MKIKLYFFRFGFPLLLLIFKIPVIAQPGLDYSRPFIATSQLGFRESSVKEVSFFGGDHSLELPDEIPFYITRVGYRIPRQVERHPSWENSVFRWHIDFDTAEYIPEVEEAEVGSYFLYRGVLKKEETAWGIIWSGNFSDFQEPGVYQIENLYAFSVPFELSDKIYERFEREYLEYLRSQRSGVEVPGVRPVENADDARLWEDSTYYLPVAGGWNDAGDWRKWLSLTQPNIEALALIIENGHPFFSRMAEAELEWGLRYYHHMINDEGRVYEDVGGGKNRAGNYKESWWNEGHPGVTDSGDLKYDNIPMNGIERHVRTNYNPFVQFQFVRFNSIASRVLGPPLKNNCLILADRAWKYAESSDFKENTLFLSEQLLAALELYVAGSPNITLKRIREIAENLLDLQETGKDGLRGYFMEMDNSDAFRSIAFNAEPAMALLRLSEWDKQGLEDILSRAKKALTLYIDEYLLTDAQSNPFGITPYGVYVDPPYPSDQKFRDAGKGRGVRTYIHVYSEDPIPHGVNQVSLYHGYIMARASKLFDRADWKKAAERMLNWSTGHNNYGLCLYTSLGFRHPVPASFVNYKIPSAMVVGFLGRPDDTPYIETSNAIEWSTQEIWDIPWVYTIGLAMALKTY